MTDNNIGVTSTPDDSYSHPEGTTTEPDPQSQIAVQKGSCCEKCLGKSCDGNCCEKCMGMTKATDQQVDDDEELEKASKPEDEETEADEPDADEDDKIKKSEWGGAFAPGVPTAALRTVFRMED